MISNPTLTGNSISGKKVFLNSEFRCHLKIGDSVVQGKNIIDLPVGQYQQNMAHSKSGEPFDLVFLRKYE